MIAEIELVADLGVGLIFGIVCASIAAGRGRSAIGWFFLGLFFPCISFIILLVIPNLAEEEKRREAHLREVRRLKEQLKKERQVADQRHIAQRQRLEAHDRALGLDTSAADQKLIEAGAAPPRLTDRAEDEPGAAWWHAAGGERNGPIDESELRALLRERRIDGDTLVWREGMDDWAPARDLPELIPDIPD